MNPRRTLAATALTALTVAVAAAPAGADAPTAAASQVREYEGVVTAVNRSARTFRLRDSERGTIRIRVTAQTRYERIAGFAGLRVGMCNVEATVRRSNGAWIAREVERSGGGGEHRDDRGRGRGDDD